MESIIFHIDVNSAFLSWEAVYRLAHKGGKQDLREIASAVGGDITMRHRIILAMVSKTVKCDLLQAAGPMRSHDPDDAYGRRLSLGHNAYDIP